MQRLRRTTQSSGPLARIRSRRPLTARVRPGTSRPGSHAMSTDLGRRFHEMLVKSYWDVGRATGYWAHRFRQKVVRVGGLQAARDWLARKDIPSGLDRV